MDVLDIGEPLPVRTRWWDEDGQPTEPATIALTITKPSGAVISKTKADMTQGDTTDVWLYETTVTEQGLWRIHAEASVDGDTSIIDDNVLVGVGDDSGPCEPWCSWDDVEACGSINGDSGNEIQHQLWLDQATEILWNLTDRRYPGLCTVTRSLCYACSTCWPVVCSCDPYPGIDLSGRYPVWAVTNVTINGTPLDPGDYRLRGNRYLVKTSGQWWPTGWNTADPDRFRATWITGRAATPGGRAAAARFALEIGKRCANDSACKLPSRVTNIVRDGVSYVVLDPMTMIAEGRTGLDLVDNWIIADNIGHKPRPGAFHPALHGNRRL